MKGEQVGDNVEVSASEGGAKPEKEGRERQQKGSKRTTEAMEKLDAGLRKALRVRRHPKQNVFIPDSVLARLDSSARYNN